VRKTNTVTAKDLNQNSINLPDVDSFEQEFMTMTDLTELTGEMYEQATQNLETVAFDPFNFESMLNENSL